MKSGLETLGHLDLTIDHLNNYSQGRGHAGPSN